MARTTRAAGGAPRARLFVALDLPDGARSRLVRWRDGALAGRADLRAVAPEALHVTLVFIGHRAEDEVARIAQAVEEAVRGLSAATLAAVGVVAVPRRRPRLFALDLADADGRAAAVQGAVSGALARGGFHEPEARPFWPHVTLARVRGEGRAAPLDADPPREPFDVAAVTLYRSLLSPRGARYEAVARFALG